MFCKYLLILKRKNNNFAVNKLGGHQLNQILKVNITVIGTAEFIRVLCPEKDTAGTSLVVQWLRICLATQGTQVLSLVGELRSHTLQSS